MLFLLLAVFLFPIAVYCAALGLINRQPKPMAVAGAWDFVGVLAATSGFLLFVGPALLSGMFRQSLRDLPLQRDSNSLGEAITELWSAWWAVWVLYYLLVLLGAAFLIWTRRGTTVIYNIDPTTCDAVLERVSQRLGWEMQRRGNQLYFSVAERTTAQVFAGNSESPVPSTNHLPPSSVNPTILEVEPFALLSNVSLHWQTGSPASRADFERALREVLGQVVTGENAAGSWLLGIAALLFLLIMMMTGLFVVLTMMLARRL